MSIFAVKLFNEINMENQIPNTRPSEEIDLLELMSRMVRSIKRFFIWLYDLLISFIQFILSKTLWILSFSIIGGVFGYLLFTNTPRFYSSEMIARSNAMNNSVIVGSINLLDDIFDNRNYNALGAYLGIPVEKAEKIKSIEAFYGIDLNHDKLVDYVDYEKIYNPKDTTQKRLTDIFYLRISVYDETVFTSARDGIKQYLNTNPFVLENNRVRTLQALSLINEYKNQIIKLDSLQKVQYFEVPKLQKAGNNQMIFLNEKEARLYHGDIISLYNRQLGLEKELMLNPDPITVIQDFTPLAKADNPLIKFLRIGILFFAVLGFFLSIIWQFRTKIWMIIKNY